MRGIAQWTRLRLMRDMKSRRKTTLLKALFVPVREYQHHCYSVLIYLKETYDVQGSGRALLRAWHRHFRWKFFRNRSHQLCLNSTIPLWRRSVRAPNMVILDTIKMLEMIPLQCSQGELKQNFFAFIVFHKLYGDWGMSLNILKAIGTWRNWRCCCTIRHWLGLSEAVTYSIPMAANYSVADGGCGDVKIGASWDFWECAKFRMVLWAALTQLGCTSETVKMDRHRPYSVLLDSK
jgi:hypothetical protein